VNVFVRALMFCTCDFGCRGSVYIFHLCDPNCTSLPFEVDDKCLKVLMQCRLF
jgi:hypothetical protein